MSGVIDPVGYGLGFAGQCEHLPTSLCSSVPAGIPPCFCCFLRLKHELTIIPFLISGLGIPPTHCFVPCFTTPKSCPRSARIGSVPKPSSRYWPRPKPEPSDVFLFKRNHSKANMFMGDLCFETPILFWSWCTLWNCLKPKPRGSHPC